MHVTAAHVAQHLRLSQSTVSRALAGSPLISEATRRRVQEAARSMGYRPNAAGRSLKVGRHGSIGIVVPDLGGAYGAGIAKGVLDAVRERGEQLLVADSGGTAEGELTAFETLATQADGILLVAPRAAEASIRAAAGSFRPTVLVGRGIAGLDCVLADEEPSVEGVLDHLLALGHRTVAYQGGPSDAPSEVTRWRVLRAYAARHPELRLVRLAATGSTPQDGAAAAAEVAERRLGAVIAFNDLTALGLIGALRSLGLDVPCDVSVVGWDDTVFATLVPPHLTSVSMSLDSLAAAAAARLFALIEDPSVEPRVQRLPTSVRVRASTARPPTPDQTTTTT